jgi:ribosome biogenesis protein SSF1/2
MARRRKTRTHNKGTQPATVSTSDNVPKSFVIKHGQVGSSLAQLVRDVRKVMEPNTASRLRVRLSHPFQLPFDKLIRTQAKERSRNKLKDYLVMAPALKVSHLLAFTLTDVAPSLRMVRLSDGPTLSFRVERYSLIKDIKAASRHAKNMGAVEYLSPPLVRRHLLNCVHKIFTIVNHSSSSRLFLSQVPARPRTSLSS